MTVIPHGSDDAWIARQMASHIRTAGGDVFLDEAAVHRGDDFMR